MSQTTPPPPPLSPLRQAARWVKRSRLRFLRAISSDKAHYNSLLNQREMWQGRARLDSFPREIQIGTNWTCNLRCFFCRRQHAEAGHLSALKAQEREIPQIAMDRLLDIMPYIERFTLTPLGEPLLYSGLDHVLDRHRASRCQNLQLTTNGNVTTENRARQLVEAGVRRIFVSIDSADPANYAMMRVGGTLAKVTEGLQRLNEWKDRLGRTYPEIVINSSFMRQNIADLPELVRYAHANRIRKISVLPMEAEDPSMEPDTLAHHIPPTLESLSEASRIAADLGVELLVHLALRNLLSAHGNDPRVKDLLTQEHQLDTRGRSLMDKCAYPWTFLIVDTNGDVRPCCWTSMCFGNLARQPFQIIWNSPAAIRMRTDFLANSIPPSCRARYCRVDL